MGRDTAAGASRAASKTRAASRAASSASGAPGGGFGGFGFGGYAGGVALDTVDDASSDAVGDEDVERAMRRCAHKSSTATKLKALRELHDALFGESAATFDATSGENDASRVLVKSPDVVMMMLKPWTRTYEKLSADGDVGVRRDATIMHGHIARASGKSLAKVLKGTSMMASWVKTMSDPNGEVAQAARDAFSRTFSTEERRSGAIAIAHAEILDDLGECLRRASPADMLFREGSENEQFGRFERSILVSLGALAATCSQLHEVESDDADKAAHACSALVLELKCLRTQIKSEYSSIRREAYATLATLAKCAANAKASPAWREALARCVPSIAAVAFALISTEQDQACMSHMWDLILGVAIAHPSAWDVIDVEKSFVPSVSQHFARACHGAASTSAPSLLPLLAHMPAQSLIRRSDDGSGTPMSGLVGILDAVFTGWLASSASAVRANEAKATLPALREGMLYGILKLAPMTDHAEECAQVILHTRVVDRWMREFLARGDADALDVMCDALKTLGTKPHSASAVVDAWSKLGDITEDALRDPERADIANGMYSRMLAANAGAETSASTAAAPFAMAVFANALETPSLENSVRLASMIEHLGVAVFDGGADALMRYCLSSSNPVPGAGTIVAAVMKRDAARWDEALEDALAKDDTRVVAETLQTLVKEHQTTPDAAMNAWARDALDALVERCATMIMSTTDVDVLVAVGGFKDALTSTTAASATLDVLARECANLHESPGLRRATRAWMWPPPSAAAVLPAWSACVGAFFHEALYESLATTSAYRVRAERDAGESSSASESENDEIEFEETGEIHREWIAALRAIRKDAANDAATLDARRAAVAAIANTGARAAWEYREERVDVGLALRLWAQKTVHALDAFDADVDADVARDVALAALERYAGDDGVFRWLDALQRARFGWRALFEAMISVDIDAALDVASYALTRMPAERHGAERAERVRSSRAFSRVVCGRELRRVTLAALIPRVFARSGEREAAASAVDCFLRRARELDSDWNDSDDARDALDVALAAYAGAAAAGRNADDDDGDDGDDAAFAKASLATFLPRLLPSDISNASDPVRGFVDGVVQACIEGIRDRRAPLDGPALALVAACFTRGDDVDGAGVVGPLNDAASAAALMDVFRALAKRDAADAAAEAASARFGAPQSESAANLSSKKTLAILSGDAGVADVTIAIIRRCAAALDARDWGAVFGRMGAWMSNRVSAATVATEDDDRSDADIKRAADMLARVATIAASIAALPIEVAEPRERNAGDVVPYAARGEDAVKIARALAAADWPRERAEIMKDVYACAILAGAELHDIRACDVEARRCEFRRRMALERDMWRKIADCACAPSCAASSAALQAALYVDDLDDAPCETVSALYALLLEPNVEDDARRAAYAMLASDALLQSAVVGLDARVADVAKVERALDATLAAARDDDHQPNGAAGVAFIDESSPGERAGMREDLDEALKRDDIAGATERYAWALLLRYVLALDVTSSCHERLVNYTRETKAIPRMLRALVPEMPLPRVERAGKGAVVALSKAWRDADWTDPTAPAHMFNARLSVDTLLYGAALRALPASVRTFVHDLKPAKHAKALEAATAASVSSTLIAAEFAAVSATSFSSSGGSGDMSVRASASTREVLARYEIDESFLELVVKLPSTYPLEPAELRCAQRVGITEQRLRKWMLGISSILTHQNGAVAQCLLQWQRNITAEFSGVEPCPICYSVIHPVDHRKPSLRCRQCSNTFHATCLYTWFRTGSRSICPLCQQQWGTSLRD